MMPDSEEQRVIAKLIMNLAAIQSEFSRDPEACHSRFDDALLDYFDRRYPPGDGVMTVREVYGMFVKWTA